MADFPPAGFGIGMAFETSLKPNAHTRVTVMKDHSFVIQKDSSTILYAGVIVCPHLTATQKAQIDTFYTNNEDTSWTFDNPHDGGTYTLFFTGAVSYVREEREASILYIARLPVIGTKN